MDIITKAISLLNNANNLRIESQKRASSIFPYYTQANTLNNPISFPNIVTGASPDNKQ